MTHKKSVFFYCVVAFSLTFSSQAFAQSGNRAMPKEKRSDRAPITKESDSKIITGKNENLLFAWIGTGFGATYLHNLKGSVSLGGQISVNSEQDGYYSSSISTNDLLNYYQYNIRYSLESISAAGQISWLSDVDEGFLLSGVVGLTRLSSSASGTREFQSRGSLQPIASTQVSQTVSSTGFGGGIQGGYLWTFDSGLCLGILANLIAATASEPLFDPPSPQVTQDAEAMSDLSEASRSNRSTSSLGLVIGISF